MNTSSAALAGFRKILALHKVQIGRIFLIANVMGGCFVIVKSEKNMSVNFYPIEINSDSCGLVYLTKVGLLDSNGLPDLRQETYR